jgi:hypothetical protein
MIVHRHTDQLSTQHQTPREFDVVPAGLEISRRMIVIEQYAARTVEEREAKELRPVDRRLGAGAETELVDGQEAIAPIETYEAEDLAGLRLHPADQELAGNLWLVETFGGPHHCLGKSLSKLYRRHHGRDLGWAESRSGGQLMPIEPGNTSQASDVG